MKGADDNYVNEPLIPLSTTKETKDNIKTIISVYNEKKEMNERIKNYFFNQKQAHVQGQIN